MTVTRERIAFRSGPEFLQTVANVNAKLGFTESEQLSADEIITLWDICRMEKGIDINRAAPWCAAFSVADNQVIEYLEDLDYFYRNGYGVNNRRLLENLSCGVIQDMLQFLQSTNPDDAPARIFGTHSSPVQFFLVTLGVFEDHEFLTRHNAAQQMTRQWKSSWISAYGSNLAVIRYE